ncbi:hypothetical protein EYS21_23060 [Arthrobacter sp. S39]|nr:hypothetical protein EYS21_23060 [Arthrobacter sp. S39]
MKSLQFSNNSLARGEAEAATGHHAPASGWWRPEGEPMPYRYVQEGEVLPSLQGHQVQWTLVLELPPARRWPSRAAR